LTIDNSPPAHIDAQHLGKRFNREWIFKDLSYRFEAGNTYGITGPNGSGKSTALQVLWGQLPQSAGELSYSIDNQSIPVEEIYSHVSIATPYLDLIEEFTLEETVRFHFSLRHPRHQIQLADVVARMELEHARHKPLQHFSSGMRQRVKLALALYTEAAFVFLDEPFTNLDKHAIAWYQQQLPLLGKSVVLIASNDPAEYAEAKETLRVTDFKNTI
jgi:ABC-type multidrug transport system ATPase subunit